MRAVEPARIRLIFQRNNEFRFLILSSVI
jgi:hypothetical protein